MATKLNDIIADMVASEERCSQVLSRGLVLAFTPQNGDGRRDGARFVWSRLDDHPSEIEDEIVKKAITEGMRKVARMVVINGPMFRTGLVIKVGWGSSKLEWQWVRSSLLMELTGRRRARALEWIGR